MSFSREYKQLRKVILRGRSARVRLAALNELVASSRPPSMSLLNELLKQPELPAELVLAVIAAKRIFDKGNHERNNSTVQSCVNEPRN